MKKAREIVGEYLHRGNDILVLKSIYDFKCLTLEQIYKLHSGIKCKELISEFVRAGLLLTKGHPHGDVFFLTTLGINILRYTCDMPDNLFDNTGRLIKRGYYRAYELAGSSRDMTIN